jgi:hypothetical protein
MPVIKLSGLKKHDLDLVQTTLTGILQPLTPVLRAYWRFVSLVAERWSHGQTQNSPPSANPAATRM